MGMGTFHSLIFVTGLDLLKIFCTDCSNVCTTGKNELPDSYLNGSVFKEYRQLGFITCARFCKNTPPCKSFNYMKAELKCELNSGTESTNTVDALAGSTYFNMENDSWVYPSSCDQLQCSSAETCFELSDGQPVCRIERCDMSLLVNGIVYSEPYRPLSTFVETCKLPDHLVSDTTNIYLLEGTRQYVCGRNGEWTFVTGTCQVRNFSIHTDMTDFDTARSRCISLGGDLVVLDTAQKDMAVGNAVFAKGWTGISHEDDSYFIGFDDRALQGTYKWINGNGLVYRHWDTNQPDESHPDENCGAIAAATKKWHDNSCTLLWSNYICESVIYI